MLAPFVRFPGMKCGIRGDAAPSMLPPMITRLVVIALVIAAISAFRAFQRRQRMQALVASDDNTPTCAIPRPGVQRFFADTQMLRSVTEEIVRPVNKNTADYVHADHALEPTQAEHAQRVFDWSQSYFNTLDDGDRAALGERGVHEGTIQHMSRAAEVFNKPGLHKFVQDLRQLERQMST